MFNKLTTRRIVSIDAFRGMTIAVMVFVNELSGVRDIPRWMKHMPANEDAMSFVDVVFPAFLFIAGMSIPFAFANRATKKPGLPSLLAHIGWRTLGLLVFGVFMVNDEGGNHGAMPFSIHIWSLLFYVFAILIWKVYAPDAGKRKYILQSIGVAGLLFLAIVYRGGDDGTEYFSPKWWGILGLIGWAYLVSCLTYLLVRGQVAGLLIMILLLTIFFGITIHNGWDDFPAKNGTHIATMLAGMIASLLLFDENSRRRLAQRIWVMLGLAGMFFLTGAVLRAPFPLSKIHATPSWGFYCDGICVLLYLFLYWLVDLRGIRRWINIVWPAAASPLLTYLIPDIIFTLTAYTGIRLFPGKWAFGWPGGLYCVAFTLLVLLIARFFQRIRLRLQL